MKLLTVGTRLLKGRWELTYHEAPEVLDFPELKCYLAVPRGHEARDGERQNI